MILENNLSIIFRGINFLLVHAKLFHVEGKINDAVLLKKDFDVFWSCISSYM